MTVENSNVTCFGTKDKRQVNLNTKQTNEIQQNQTFTLLFYSGVFVTAIPGIFFNRAKDPSAENKQ